MLVYSSRFLLLLVLLTTACAYTESVPILDGTERGFTYPTCYPFLVVSGAKADLLMVPNPNKQRAARFGAFLAKNDLDVTFETCGPSQIKSNMDSTTVAVSLLNSLTEAQKAGKLFGATETGGESGQSFQVFEFVFNDRGTFIGLKPHISPQDFVRVQVAETKKDIALKEETPKGSAKPDDPLKKKQN